MCVHRDVKTANEYGTQERNAAILEQERQKHKWRNIFRNAPIFLGLNVKNGWQTYLYTEYKQYTTAPITVSFRPIPDWHLVGS